MVTAAPPNRSVTSTTLLLARRFGTREVLAALGLVLAAFLILDFIDSRGFDSLRFFDLNDSDVAHRITLSSVVIGSLFGCAAALAAASSRTATRDTRGSFWFRVAAVMFAAVGIDEALGIHAWANAHGAPWALSYLPLAAAATVAWYEMAARFESRRTARLCMAGIGAFLVSCAFDAARAGEPHSYAVGELLEMAAASLFVASLVRRAHQYRPMEFDEVGRDGDVLAIGALAERLDPRKLALAAAAAVLLLGVMGAISHSVSYMRVFDVNKEQNYASMFSGLALWAAAAIALCNAIMRDASWFGRRWWIALAAVFVYLGLDEMAALHEELQHLTGIWGQTFLLPVVIVGVAAWFVILRAMRGQRIAASLWVAGAACWVVSQGIDLLLNGPMPWTTIPEELGEMSGSLMFGFALLVALRSLVLVS